MPDLAVLNKDPTLEALEQQLVLDNPAQQRTYIGGSVIGRECERELWYAFRWVLENSFDAATLARFADGHASEAIIAERLKSIHGLRLWTHDEQENQYGYRDLGGHLRMHLDGVVKGLVQAPKTPHVWEHKCVNERKFKSLEKKKKDHGEKMALEHWDTTYFSQAQMYMGQSGLKRHYLTVATPGSRDLTSCRSEFDPAVYKWLMEKAQRVAFSETPPPPISRKADHYLCRWCNFTENCHGSKIARVNCRTCAHVTPLEDGSWRCEYHNKALSNKDQRAGCGDHVFIPDLVPFADSTDMDAEANTISYQTKAGTRFINASTNDFSKYQFASRDLQHLDDQLLDSETDFFSLMARFEGARIKSVVKAKEKPKPEIDSALITN